MTPITPQDMMLRIGAALVFGAIIGAERQMGKHPAGFRTMTLIAIGSAAFVLVVLEVGNARPELSTDAEAQATSRVLQGLTTGIGFLGAGTIVRNDKSVQGLTTAAAVWCIAAVGAACGLGQLMLAATVTGAALVTLVVMKIAEMPLHRAGGSSHDTDAPKHNGGAPL
ncbi:MAG: MgtC/SapB family protein [Phycisphaerales bacterium]|nr:MgtC/SapB family protein [Planctomycetota bacterium]